MIRRTLTCVAALTLVGCLPVELDVTPDGDLIISRQEGWFRFEPETGEVVKLRDAGGDVPVFARVSPDGQQLLTVAERKDGYSDFDVRIGPVSGDSSRLVLKTRNPTYLLFSPDGSRIAMTRMSTEPHDSDKEEETLELVLVDIESGEVRLLARNVGPLIRWLNEGKELLATRIVQKNEQQQLLADVVRIDVASGNATPIARVLAGDEHALDVSSDGKQAALCALDAGPPGTELKANDFARQRLLLLDLTTGAVRKTKTEAVYAIYSPDGKSLLVGSPPFSGTLAPETRLLVGDRTRLEWTTVAEDLHVESTLGGVGQVYPGWLDNDRLFYFKKQRTYGRTGEAMSLMLVRRDGTQRRSVQPLIDTAAIKDADHE